MNLIETRTTPFRVSFQDLIVPRTGRLLNRIPAFLPGEYNGPGGYNLALPGGGLVQVELRDWLMILLVVAWFAGAIALIIHFWRSNRKLLTVGRSGRLLWEAPLTFGECDAALRVKRLVKWKKRPWLLSFPMWPAVLVLALFLNGGHTKLQPAEDMLLAWERDKGSVEAFVEDLEFEIAEELFGKGFVNDGTGLKGYQEYCEQFAKDIHVTEVWEAPEDNDSSVLWAREASGKWYYIRYAWWCMDSGWINVRDVEEYQAPDLSACRQLI